MRRFSFKIKLLSFEEKANIAYSLKSLLSVSYSKKSKYFGGTPGIKKLLKNKGKPQ